MTTSPHTIDIQQLPFYRLEEYSTIPIHFLVQSQYIAVPSTSRTGGWELTEYPVEKPYVKDYDSIPGNHPTELRKWVDLTNWGMYVISLDSRPVGGMILAYKTPGVDLLEGRDDLAVLWDIRVREKARRCGFGHHLFQVAKQWAIERNCRELKIETQQINVPACKFYSRVGCELVEVNENAYPDLPDEIQFIFRIPL